MVRTRSELVVPELDSLYHFATKKVSLIVMRIMPSMSSRELQSIEYPNIFRWLASTFDRMRQVQFCSLPAHERPPDGTVKVHPLQ